MVSLRTSPLSWCGNPPVLPGAYRYVSPLNQGIPTPVCATSRNDSVISVFQLLIRIWGEGLELQYETFPLGGRWQPEGLTDEGKPWRFPQLPDQLECARMPQRNAVPRGEGAPARGRMRNGDLFRIGMHFDKKVHWERLYRLNEPRLRMGRCRHSSSTASRSPFPPGEGIVRHSSLQTPIYQAAEQDRYTHNKTE